MFKMTVPIRALKGPVILTSTCLAIKLRTWGSDNEPDDHCGYHAKQMMEKSNFYKAMGIELLRRCPFACLGAWGTGNLLWAQL